MSLTSLLHWSPQYCLYLGYLCTNLNKISTSIMASRPASKISYQLTLKKLVQDTISKIRWISNYTTDFYKTLVEMMALWPATEIISTDLEKCRCRRLFTKIIISHLLYDRYYQTAFNKFSFNNYDVATEIFVVMRIDPHYNALDNCLLYMFALHTPAIYLWFTALVCLFCVYIRIFLSAASFNIFTSLIL